MRETKTKRFPAYTSTNLPHVDIHYHNVVDLDPHGTALILVSWIRIRIGIADRTRWAKITYKKSKTVKE
jgi:hypothetical protein